MRHSLHIGSVVVGLFCMGDSAARGDVIFNITAQPASNDLPGFTYGYNANGSLAAPAARQLRSGPGAISNGDGTSLLGQQLAPGLEFDVPYSLGATATAPGEMLGMNSTSFYDTSLVLSSAMSDNDFKAVGPARQSGQTMIQDLSGGSFSIFASADASDPNTRSGASALLLSGTIGSSTISGSIDGTAGAVFNAGPVTFTGGSLMDSIPSTTGSDSFTLAVSGDGFTSSDGYLSAFSANITGSLTAAVPLPPQFWPGMFVLGGVVLTPAIRRRLREHAMMGI